MAAPDSPSGAGLLAIAEAASGEAFRRSGRTLHALGLAGQSRDGMRKLLQEGL